MIDIKSQQTIKYRKEDNPSKILRNSKTFQAQVLFQVNLSTEDVAYKKLPSRIANISKC